MDSRGEPQNRQRKRSRSLDTPTPVPIRSTSRINELTKLFFEVCQYVEQNVEDRIPFELTEEEYKGKIMSWKERTSTSPGSNMHLGHLRAYWCQHLLKEGSDEETELDNNRTKILKGHLVLLNYALRFGYSCTAWRMIVNSMLEKDPGTPKIHRLHVIHL
jgi:hypothetical protein